MGAACLTMIRPLLEQPWFAALGSPLSAAEQAMIAGYLEGFSLDAEGPARAVAGWEEAAELVRSPAGRWWACEEAERRRLESCARVDPADREWMELNDVLHAAATVAAGRFARVSAAMIKTAAGAGCYAAYHWMLATAAALPDRHPFLLKYALFAGGRWPLGIYDGRFAIF